MHHYLRRRTSITGLALLLRKIIELGRMVVVVMARHVGLFCFIVVEPNFQILKVFEIDAWPNSNLLLYGIPRE